MKQVFEKSIFGESSKSLVLQFWLKIRFIYWFETSNLIFSAHILKSDGCTKSSSNVNNSIKNYKQLFVGSIKVCLQLKLQYCGQHLFNNLNTASHILIIPEILRLGSGSQVLSLTDSWMRSPLRESYEKL